jgi:DNA-binding transcriptional MerR regulator
MAVLNPQTPQGYQIGQAAQRSGVSAANIRFYEKEKLIPARGYGASSYRIYSEEDLHQLRFIRLLRSLNMSLAEVRTLLHLDLRKKTHCQTARDTLDEHIDHVRTRLKELRGLEKDLTALRGQCDGQGEQCHLIEALHARANSDLHNVVGTPRQGKAHAHV